MLVTNLRLLMGKRPPFNLRALFVYTKNMIDTDA